MVDSISNAIVYFFNDIIFMHLMGWWAKPLYDLITRNSAEVLAKIMLFIVETAFWTIIVVLIIKLIDKLLSGRKMSRATRLELNKQKIEKNRKLREAKQSNIKATDLSEEDDDEYSDETDPEDYKSYDDDGDYKDFDD